MDQQVVEGTVSGRLCIAWRRVDMFLFSRILYDWDVQGLAEMKLRIQAHSRTEKARQRTCVSSEIFPEPSVPAFRDICFSMFFDQSAHLQIHVWSLPSVTIPTNAFECLPVSRQLMIGQSVKKELKLRQYTSSITTELPLMTC